MPEDKIAYDREMPDPPPEAYEEPGQTIGYDREYGYPNAPSGLAPSAGLYAPIHPHDTPEMVAEKRKFYIQQMVAVLRQAYNIRHDAALMTQIRLYLRNEKDELTDLLDEIA